MRGRRVSRDKKVGFNCECVIQSVAAEDANAHALGERVCEATRSKSWLLSSVLSGGLSILFSPCEWFVYGVAAMESIFVDVLGA